MSIKARPHELFVGQGKAAPLVPEGAFPVAAAGAPLGSLENCARLLKAFSSVIGTFHAIKREAR